VLHPFTLSIAKGELLALLGPSGCGKTTTLRILAGLEKADEGRVLIDGEDVTSQPPEKRGLGMVFQQYAVWPHRTVERNVAYPLERTRLAKDEIASRVREALTLVRLDHLATRAPHQLSGGQLQRVALARALVARPRVLLLDEPLSNLDALLREEMRAEIRSLQRRLSITTVLVTHDQAEALAIADRVAVMNAGRIEQLAAPEEVYAAPSTPFVARFVGGGNVVDARCEGGRIVVGSSSLPAPSGAPAGNVCLVVRPEHVTPDASGLEMIVRDRLYLGDRVELRVEWEGATLRALVPASSSAPAAGAGRFTFSALRVIAR
jgi:ABC-type Fe3+/spermidine/putrescine transport system ATPase subunit